MRAVLRANEIIAGCGEGLIKRFIKVGYVCSSNGTVKFRFRWDKLGNLVGFSLDVINIRFLRCLKCSIYLTCAFRNLFSI